MKIIKWTKQPDGSLAWIDGDRTLGKVYSTEGVWRTTWYGGPSSDGGCSMLPDDFPTAHDACLAAEKHWPPPWRQFGGWLESKNGGYFRKWGSRRIVYVRQAANGWYAVRPDGKVLGQGNNVSWFATAMDACAAVEQELYTPIDADPFVGTHDKWRWIKLTNRERAA